MFATNDGIFSAKIDRKTADEHKKVAPPSAHGYAHIGPAYTNEYLVGIQAGGQNYVGSLLFSGQGAMKPDEETFHGGNVKTQPEEDGVSLKSWIKASEALTDTSREMLEAKIFERLEGWESYAISELRKFPPQSQSRKTKAKKFQDNLNSCSGVGGSENFSAKIAEMMVKLTQEVDAGDVRPSQNPAR